MCGILFWTARPDDADTLTHAVARRGPHTHGWATPAINTHGPLGIWALTGGSGPLDHPPPGLALGHSRLATSGAHHGDQPPDHEYQPLRRGPRALAHNGILPRADQHHIDSRTLLPIPDPHDFLISHGGRHALITIDLDIGLIVASTTGQPLWLRDDPGTLVITSVPLGDGFHRIPDCHPVRRALT